MFDLTRYTPTIRYHQSEPDETGHITNEIELIDNLPYHDGKFVLFRDIFKYVKRGFRKPSSQELLDMALDITEPDQPVEIKTAENGVVWINIGAVCVLRICRVKELTIDSHLNSKVK